MHKSDNEAMQQYEGHLKRLIKLKYHSNSKEGKEEHLKTGRSGSQDQSARKRRLKTEKGSSSKKVVSGDIARLQLKIPPLIGNKQKQLLHRSLQARKLPRKQAQLMLQNYLLSHRILNVKPCIKGKDLQKSFKKHQKYSGMISRGRLSSIDHLSNSRLEIFRQFQSVDKSERMGQYGGSKGSGNFIFSIRIKQFQTIVRNKMDNKLFNLVIKLTNKRYRYTHLALNHLKSVHSLHFKSKHTKNNTSIDLDLQVINSNEVAPYAYFTINTLPIFQRIQQLKRDEEYSIDRKDEINALKSRINGRLMGTVQYDYTISSVPAL